MFAFCSYIYGEMVAITESIAAGSLLYAAKKYIITGLVSNCWDVLEKSISLDTVCTVLQLSMFFDEDKLQKKCLDLIGSNAEFVFDTEAFMNISHDTLKTVVSLNAIAATEQRVFESCVRWAKHQLANCGNENPTDEEIRAKLGDALYQIRFPAMAQEEFSRLTMQSKILTAEEKHDVYVYLVAKERLDSLKFMTVSRLIENSRFIVSV